MLSLQAIGPADPPHLAALHAASWRSAYRGILRDEFLDADLLGNRLALWEKRLATDPANSFGLLARQDGVPVGFAYAYPGADAVLGCLLDNLHVLPAMKGRGIGRALMSGVCRHLIGHAPEQGLHLCVFEANQAARGFYEALQGEPVKHQLVELRGGGTAPEWTYAWSSVPALLAALAAPVTP